MDAIRICASRFLPQISPSKSRAMSFAAEDIPQSLPFLDVDIVIELGRKICRFTRREWRDKHAKDAKDNIDQLKRAILELERPRTRLRNLLRELVNSQIVNDSDNYDPSLEVFQKSAKRERSAPNCIFFSTNRSIVSEVAASKSRAVGSEASAYAEALSSRSLFLVQIAEWMRVQAALASERYLSGRHLRVLESAVKQFLPGYSNLRPGKDGEPSLVIDKRGISLDVRQLSDGERGVLSLVLDISRRLSQANPTLTNPLRQGEALILIDELDLHLHPQWQRIIVERLVKLFPRCQFIATTHSPQIVAAVEPEQVLLMKNGEIIRPDNTLGMDTNWILRHLMEAEARPLNAARRVREIEELIRGHQFKKARAAIALAMKKGYDLPEWSMLEARMARMEILAK